MEESRFSVDNLLSHSTVKLRVRIPLCFKMFLGSKNFMNLRGGRRDFWSKSFCLRVTKLSLEKAF